MQIKNTYTSYGFVAKLLHWLIALLVIGMLTFGFFLDDIPKEYKGTVFNIHKLTGLTILSLMVLRLLWALANKKPQLPVSTLPWQRLAERIVHFSLYFFVISMPLAGWIGSSAAGKFPHIGDFQLMLPVPQDKQLADISFDVHEIVAFILIAFVSMHVLAALYHHFIKRDGVLRRMM